jgi:hypothetical protein
MEQGFHFLLGQHTRPLVITFWAYVPYEPSF